MLKKRIPAVLLLMTLLVITQTLFSQKRKYDGMGAVKEILMPAQARTVGHFSLFYEATLPDDSTNLQPFWYKIVFEKDCDFTFNLFPIVENDRYDFNLFKIESDINFCEAEEKKQVLHLDDIKINRTWNDSEQTQAFRNNLVFTKTVQVKKGNTIYIELIHLWGEGIGHIIDFTTCDYSYVLKAIKNENAVSKKDSANHIPLTSAQERANSINRIKNSLCPLNGKPVQLSSIGFNETTVNIQDRFVAAGEVFTNQHSLKNYISQKTNSDSISSILKNIPPIPNNVVKLKCVLSDMYSGEFIQASPFIIDSEDGKKIHPDKLTNGVNEFTLVKGKQYKLATKTVGYRNYALSFETGNNTDSLVYDNNTLEIKLEPLYTKQNNIIHTIYFHPNTPIVRPESNFEITNLKQFLKNNTSAIIEIAGHTNGNQAIRPEKIAMSNSPDWSFEGSSRELSLKRANKIKEALISNGINEQRIKIKYYGGDHPSYQNTKNWDELRKNMRVEVSLISN